MITVVHKRGRDWYCVGGVARVDTIESALELSASETQRATPERTGRENAVAVEASAQRVSATRVGFLMQSAA